MGKDRILEKIIEVLPEIEYDVDNEISFMEEKESLHIILGNPLGSFLREKLQCNYEKGTLEYQQIKNLFDVFEELAESDEYFKNLLQVSILEPLTDQKIWENNMKQYLGPTSLSLLNHIHTYL